MKTRQGAAILIGLVVGVIAFVAFRAVTEAFPEGGAGPAATAAANRLLLVAQAAASVGLGAAAAALAIAGSTQTGAGALNRPAVAWGLAAGLTLSALAAAHDAMSRSLLVRCRGIDGPCPQWVRQAFSPDPPLLVGHVSPSLPMVWGPFAYRGLGTAAAVAIAMVVAQNLRPPAVAWIGATLLGIGAGALMAVFLYSVKYREVFTSLDLAPANTAFQFEAWEARLDMALLSLGTGVCAALLLLALWRFRAYARPAPWQAAGVLGSALLLAYPAAELPLLTHVSTDATPGARLVLAGLPAVASVILALYLGWRQGTHTQVRPPLAS